MFVWGEMNSPFRFSSDEVHVIEITDVKYEIFLLLIKHIYVGVLSKEDIPPEHAIALFVAQNQYLLDSSVSLGIIIENMSEHNVIEILALSIDLSYPEISDACLKYLLQNIETSHLTVRKHFKDKQESGENLELDPIYKLLCQSSHIWQIIVEHDDLRYTTQWVSQVLAFSSEYSGWPATNVIGITNTYPQYGDLRTAWAPKNSKGQQEYLELKFAQPMFIVKCEVYGK